jgi:phage/plasmid-like protein (TIGR03299 family)
MSHNINEGRMFYVGEKPWHALGKKLDRPATAKEAIEAARIDYEVHKVPIALAGELSRKIIDGKYATVRKDTNDVLGIVSEKYNIIQNKDAFTFFDEVVGEGQAIYHTAGALGKGEKIWIMAKLPKEIVIAREDIIEKYLLLVNSHDGTTALTMYFSPVRVVCQNTLTLSFRKMAEKIGIRHTESYRQKISEARRILGITQKFYQEFEQDVQKMVEYKLTESQASFFFDRILKGHDIRKKESTKYMNEMKTLIRLFYEGQGNQIAEVEKSLWAAVNAVTEYIDHYKPVKKEESFSENRIRSILLGHGAFFKTKAYEEALMLVKK